MKIDLLEINKETKKTKQNIEIKEALFEAITDIVKGEETHTTKSEQLIIALNIKKVEKQKVCNPFSFESECRYTFNLNRTNIKKIQKYIDEEGI